MLYDYVLKVKPALAQNCRVVGKRKFSRLDRCAVPTVVAG